ASASVADVEEAAPALPLQAEAFAAAARAGSVSAPDDWPRDGYSAAARPMDDHSSPVSERDGLPEDDWARAGCSVELDGCSAAALPADGSAPLAASGDCLAVEASDDSAPSERPDAGSELADWQTVDWADGSPVDLLAA